MLTEYDLPPTVYALHNSLVVSDFSPYPNIGVVCSQIDGG